MECLFNLTGLSELTDSGGGLVVTMEEGKEICLLVETGDLFINSKDALVLLNKVGVECIREFR